MEIIIQYWNPRNELVTDEGFTYMDQSSVVTEEKAWNDDSKENLFKRFYKENNSLRYCNGSCLKFKDPSIEREYLDWYSSLDKGTKFSMYYGNGTVD